jgi:hypothetical protein
MLCLASYLMCLICLVIIVKLKTEPEPQMLDGFSITIFAQNYFMYLLCFVSITLAAVSIAISRLVPIKVLATICICFNIILATYIHFAC